MKELAPRRAENALDHMLLGIADLERGIDWVSQKTGVTAVTGGSHPGAGTRNALLSMGKRQYIEIISIDPKQTSASRTVALIQKLSAPILITWAVATTDIFSIMEAAIEAGYAVEGPSNGSRVKPDGGTLGWKTLRIISDYGDVIPFFIQWNAGIVHPAQESPSGCRLVAFEITHPKADEVRKLLQRLGITASVHQGGTPQLRAVINSPAGSIHLP